MPELPEVETMRRGILGVVGARIDSVERVACRRKPIAVAPRIDRFRRRAVGRTIRGVDRVGKRVVVRLDSDDAIVLEPRMTGLVLVADPPTREHLRFRCTLIDCPESVGDCPHFGRKSEHFRKTIAKMGTVPFSGTLSGRPRTGNGHGGAPRELLYWDRRGLGSVRLFSPDEFATELGPAKVGPDALTITAEILRSRLSGSRRAIKVALLDQRAVAGIGNLYASEILHAARIHPARRCNRMTRAQWRALADATRAILAAAIRHEGSTLGDGTYRNALNEAGGYQNHHRVYDRVGKACPRCGEGSRIQRIVQGQRSTFFCPSCQLR